MDGPSQQPQRRRTLRHVKKQNLLRQSVHAPERTSGSTLDGHKRLPQPPPRKRRESPVSRDRSRPPSAQNTSSNHHIGDSKARREIWSNGGIPVIVVPDRRSSNHGKSREPSLRSTSSRRSKRSASVGSPQRTRVGSLDMSRPDSLQSRGRDLSKPARDERTMDFAPPIPPRSSSLSAPTSRNASRTTSLTTESIRAHNAMQKREDEAKASRLLMLEDLPTPALPLAPLPASPRRAPDAHLHRDSAMDLHHSEDAMSTKKYSSRNTPFSVASVATTGTVPEVSEALEVHMYAHQNSSVVMVNHSSRPSDSPTAGFADEQATPQLVPTITTTRANDGPPSTPPKQMTKISDIDSPLRNPRVPPEPPAHPPVLNLIPATPSGTTPSYESEQKLGNYFEISPPRRRPSLIQRAFSRRRRNSVDYPPTASKPAGRLTRSFSLSRSIGLSPDLRHREDFETDIDGEMSPKRSSKEPAEKDKLHPFWRPQFDDQECEYGDSCPHHSKRDMIYRYPLVDNRPRPPKRSLTARMKNTFAIMPIRNNENEEQYPVEESIHWPERRIIRRTPSGNLRVMQRRASLDSSPTSPRPERHHAELRPSTDMDQIRRPFWRAGPLRRAETADAATTPRRTRRFSLSDKLEDIPHLPWHLTEKRREKRTQELRQMISAPTQVRDGVGDVIRHGNTWGDKEAFNANPSDF
ncbi:hypothetical protein NQ176_g10647 [Zarea fungicola]|uniref:Uncharacterized protein n=1 Tax=Zarea fungicola TaxID=93591 RepID=A0ACC1MGJ6_9HYPO|nr:hypothetical protein NQ176_g10647 [Lecanicillium fungicola]